MIGHLEILPSNPGKSWPNAERHEMKLTGYRDNRKPYRNESLRGDRTNIGADTCSDGTGAATTSSISITMVPTELMN